MSVTNFRRLLYGVAAASVFALVASIALGAAPANFAWDGNGNLFTSPGQGTVQRINSGYIAPGQTAKTFAGKVALSTTLTTTTSLYTVSTGKTFIITDIYLSADNTQVMDTQIQAAGVSVFRAIVKGDTAPIQMTNIATEPTGSAGQAMTILWPISTNANGYYFVSGVEQ